MQPLRLTAQQLFPAHPVKLSHEIIIQSPWLLGQQRCINAWKLFTQCSEQHLYLSNFSGFDAEKLLQALAEHYPFPTPSNHANTEGNVDLNSSDKPISAVTFISQPLSKKSLIGSIDKNGHYQPGLLSKSQILVLPAEGFADKASRWDVVKAALKRGFITTQDGNTTVPVTCKIVIVGDALTYDALHEYDPEFSDHINLFAEIQHELFIDDPEADLQQWAQAAEQISLDYRALPLTVCGLTQLARYASRLCEHQQRLSLSWHRLGQLLAQTNRINGSSNSAIYGHDIEYALNQLRWRHNSIEIQAQRNIEEALVRVDTQGERIGQINGLTVVDYLGHSYGEPARITVSVHYGDGEVADIERKSELGGNIHAKGMMILSACLYRIFGQDEALHLSASIVFEQSYQTIDGDSASLAEYCCLISSIAEVPIKQSFGLTGAVDQFGNVQAIGGINEKIEGFFHLCQSRGLTGEQGVIIPKANLCQLNLSQSVIDAVEKDLFQIYQVDNVEEALSLITGEEVGIADKDQLFADNTVYGKVQIRLERMAGDLDEPLPWFTRLLGKLLGRS
ncbi:MAG: S16 family serine protease [Ferrimonas sp.]